MCIPFCLTTQPQRWGKDIEMKKQFYVERKADNVWVVAAEDGSEAQEFNDQGRATRHCIAMNAPVAQPAQAIQPVQTSQPAESKPATAQTRRKAETPAQAQAPVQMPLIDRLRSAPNQDELNLLSTEIEFLESAADRQDAWSAYQGRSDQLNA